MRITLDETEIKTAITNYLLENGNSGLDNDIDINVIAGRRNKEGIKSHSAEVTITKKKVELVPESDMSLVTTPSLRGQLQMEEVIQKKDTTTDTVEDLSAQSTPIFG